MLQILPAIIPTSKEDLLSSLESVRFAPRVQIDVVDGILASPASWPYSGEEGVLSLGQLFPAVDVMVDMMTVEPLKAARDWLAVGADEIVVHLESMEDITPMLELKREHDFLLYIAGDDEMPIEEYVKYLPFVDGVQLMGIDEIGKQSQPFSPRVIENIKNIRNLDKNIPIIIDGSVNADTLPSLLEAGATDFVVGSAIMKLTNKRAAYLELLDLLR